MADDGPWWEAIGPVAQRRPDTAVELVAALDELARVASRWSELLEDLRTVTRRIGGPGAGASFDLACRRSEQSFIELEIARSSARAAVYDQMS